MKKAWRLIKERHKKNSFTGEGARIAGGRWNHRGIVVVYTSETLSLAVIELFVHLDIIEAKFPLVYFPVEIPDVVKIEEINPDNLPRSWQEEPPPDETKDLGTLWVNKAGTAVLKVPSVVIPGEFNLLLNPAHPDFKKIKIGHPLKFSLDRRMVKI